MTALRVQRLSGAAIGPYLDDLARLRIRVFRDFPYLYEGSLDYEARYLQTYLDSPASVMVLVSDGDAVVGASSGVPLAAEAADLRRPFEQRGLDVGKVFYCGESVLLAEYRGRGLGHAFFDHREAHARALGGFDSIGFAAVERPADHPRRPADYRPLDAFWHSRGYTRRPELATTFDWKDLDEQQDSPKPMTFWLKRL